LKLYGNYSSNLGIIIYICSTKIRLIIELMETIHINNEKILFKEYFETLDTDSKNAIRDSMMAVGIAYSTFYTKVSDNSFKELEFRELERITKKNFLR